MRWCWARARNGSEHWENVSWLSIWKKLSNAQWVHWANGLSFTSKVIKKKIAKSIVVPPFVSLSAIGSSNPNFAIDLAEAFIIDMQNIGLPTAELLWANISIDYQTDYLTYLEKSSGYDDIGYVLKGTMRKQAMELWFMQEL